MNGISLIGATSGPGTTYPTGAPQFVILYFSVLLEIPTFYLRAFVLLLYIRNFQNDRLKDQNFQTLL